MNKQPKALRLADALETLSPLEREAAIQLRRLHEVNQELLEALKWALSNINCEPYEWSDEENADAHEAARAAIAKATGETNE